MYEIQNNNPTLYFNDTRMDLPDDNSEYKKRVYWDKRYMTEDEYDWFKRYIEFQHITRKYLCSDMRILNLGCGNSSLSKDLCDDGFANVVSIDYSPVVIDAMACKHRTSHPSLQWSVMDITKLEYSDSTFDAVIEKGTIDALLVEEKDPWVLSDEGAALIDTVLTEVSRVLKENGVFLSVTFAQPHFRRRLLEKQKYTWNVTYETFGDMFHYFVYVMQKHSPEVPLSNNN